MNIKDFAKAMAGLQEVFTPEKPLSKEKVEIYYQIFKKWTIEEFNNACFSLLKTKKISTFPLPAEIEEAKQGVLDDNTKAVLAYDKFTRGKARTGIYESVVFDDKNIHAVVQSMGGWHDVCLITEDEWRFYRPLGVGKRFYSSQVSFEGRDITGKELVDEYVKQGIGLEIQFDAGNGAVRQDDASMRCAGLHAYF